LPGAARFGPAPVRYADQGWRNARTGLGADVLVVTSGIATEEALRARDALSNAGVSIRHLHIHTIKPFNEQALLDHIGSVSKGVVVLENHVITGGVGSLVAEIMADNGVGKPLVRLGLNDTYAHGGSRGYLMKHYGLDAGALVRGIERIIGASTGIDERRWRARGSMRFIPPSRLRPCRDGG
jgi:transketolase